MPSTEKKTASPAQPRVQERLGGAVKATQFDSIVVPVANAITGHLPEVEGSPIELFAGWLDAYQAAAPEQRAGLEALGVELAQRRRPVFQALIRENPQVALQRAVRPVERQVLPGEVVEQLEQWVSTRGDFRAYFGRPQPGVELPAGTELTLRYLETPAKSYRAHVFGSRLEQTSRPDLAVLGVAIDRDLAVDETPVRRLDRGERVAAGAEVDQVCPVSGQTTPVDTTAGLTVEDETPVVELAGRLILLCDGTHVRVLEEAERQALGGPGGANAFRDNYPGTSAEAIGNFRCLYIRVTYPDQMRAPNSEATAHSNMRDVARFYLESSFGRLTTTSVVTPLVTLPHTKAWYIAKDSEVDGLGLVHSDARAAARRLGYDSGQFNCTIVRVNEGPRLSGISWGGGDSVWVSWDGMDVLNHECGHSLGRNHANFWQTTDGTALGLGENQEYGNSFDVMGGGGGFDAHYNVISKRALGWLSDAYVHRPGTTPAHNGVYRLHAYDQPRLEEGKRYAFRVNKDVQRQLYLEYHPAAGGQWTDAALLLVNGLGSNAGHLIDTTPGSPDGKADGGIQVGRTFSDWESDLHLTVLGRVPSDPPALDIALRRGPFPGNRPPTVTLAASATAVAPGGSVTFTATAADPDGDALSYHWDFSDGYASTNTPVVTRAFPTTDQQTICLTVSDQKGGTARAHSVLTIGNPGRGVVTGRVTAGGQPLAGVLVTSDNGKYAWTDSAGDYALADLTTGARTLTAALAGYTLTAGFANPLTVTAATLPGADWTAESKAELTLAATDAAEGGAAGSFTLSRTGDTAAALDVLVAPPSGTAVKGTDYTFRPDSAASGSLQKFTIPAGQAALTVTVAAVNDTAQEGPETILLQPAPGAYQVRRPGPARLTIADNDTTRPVVSVEATDLYATEAPGDTARLTVRRTGATTSPLTVNLVWSGSASSTADLASAPTSVVIPAGFASVDIPLVPQDDALIEPPEDATAALVVSGNYVNSVTESSATVTITDNDLATVTVTALDATLNESGRDPGVVLFTRTGSLAQPLRVFYGMTGRALHGTDYQELPGEVVIPAGMPSAAVVITPYDDAHGEVDESITVTLTLFDNAYSLGAPFAATLNLVDNADPPLVTVSANSAAEPGTAGTFTFTATGARAGTVALRYTLSGTATAGEDYTAPSGTVNIGASGTATATVSIPVLNDSLPEDTETVVLTLEPDPAYVAYNDGEAVMRLTDNDAPAVALSTHSTMPAEPATTGRFFLSRAGTNGTLTLNCAIGGTASNGVDYAALPATVTIPDGSTSAEVIVTPIDDTLAEGAETITFTLLPGAGYGRETTTAMLVLNDNDTTALPSVGFLSATGTTGEAALPNGGEYRDIEVTLSAALAVPVTAEVVVGGGSANGDLVDWALVDAAAGNAVIRSGVVTFPPGAVSRMVRVRVIDDGVAEGSETAVIELRNVNGARLSTSRNKHTLTITDADLPGRRVGFITPSTTRGEQTGFEPLLMAVLDRAPVSAPVTVSYSVSGTATAGADYQLAPGTLTFAAGETVKAVPLVLLADTESELAETVRVSLHSPQNAALGPIAEHTVVLVDANQPVVSVSAVTPLTGEDAGSPPGRFRFTRTGGANLALTLPITIGGTATAGDDYPALPASAVIPAGQTFVTLDLVPADDAMAEPDETVVVTLGDSPDFARDGPASATVTIMDNDSPPDLERLAPAAPAVALPSGVGLVCRARAERLSPAGVVAVPVAWSMVSGPGTAVFEQPAAESTGVTFPVDGLYVLRVSAGAGAGLATSDFSVSVGAALTPMRDIGTAAVAGRLVVTNGTWNLRAAGTGTSSTGTSDGFYFVSRPVTGDFDVRGRVASVVNPGGSASCRFGLMARETFAANARHAFSLYRGNGNQSFHYRLTAGAATASATSSTVYTMPRWLRLTRTGDQFASYHSADGVTWTQRGTTQTIAMGPVCHVGLALTSAVAATPSTVEFDRLNFGPVASVAPRVSAGPALSGAGPWTTAGTASDDGLPTALPLALAWSTAGSGPEAYFADPAAAATAVFFPGGGTYTLRLTADDGHTATYADTLASVTAGSPWETWRTDHFTAPQRADAAVSGEAADPDNDGLANLAEYALGSDPGLPNAGRFRLVAEDNGSQLLHPRRLAAADVVITYEKCADLAANAWIAVIPTATGIDGSDGRVQDLRATLPVEPGDRMFYRLRFTRTHGQ